MEKKRFGFSMFIWELVKSEEDTVVFIEYVDG